MVDLVPALAGGLLIGGGAALLYALSGRIAGISGIVFGLGAADSPWRLAFLASLVAGAWLALAAGAPQPEPPAASWPLLALSGVLVGFGTKLGNGCTSGHGVCGLARLSRRSLVAVLVFMGCGMATATLVHWVRA